MNKNAIEIKSLALIVLLGYLFNLIFGWTGALFDYGSHEQLLLYQLGNACAISACVMAARYTGLRGEQVAASAYILLGITHGISLAALSRAGINPDREASMVMSMVPALLFMFWCSIFPRWLKFFGLIPSMFFTLVYVNVHIGDSLIGWRIYSGYATLQITELLWGVFIYRDWKKGVGGG